MTKFIGPPAPRVRGLDYRARRLARGALMQRYLRLILTIMALIPAGSNAQTPPAIEGPVYIATYVEVVPTAADEGAALLKQYRDASRKDAGNQRMELVQELGRPS